MQWMVDLLFPEEKKLSRLLCVALFIQKPSFLKCSHIIHRSVASPPLSPSLPLSSLHLRRLLERNHFSQGRVKGSEGTVQKWHDADGLIWRSGSGINKGGGACETQQRCLLATNASPWRQMWIPGMVCRPNASLTSSLLSGTARRGSGGLQRERRCEIESVMNQWHRKCSPVKPGRGQKLVCESKRRGRYCHYYSPLSHFLAKP